MAIGVYKIQLINFAFIKFALEVRNILHDKSVFELAIFREKWLNPSWLLKTAIRLRLDCLFQSKGYQIRIGVFV